MKSINTKGGGQVPCEGSGPSVSVFVNQTASGQTGGWTLDLYAVFPDSESSQVFIKSIPIGASGPGVQPVRLLFVATIPGAVSFVGRIMAPTVKPDKRIAIGIYAGPMAAFPPTILSA